MLKFMKKKIIGFMSRYFYPQNIFAKSILKFVKPSGNRKVLIDVPCGNGETSWHFSKNKNLSVFGYDIDEKSIENAKFYYRCENLKFSAENIFDAIDFHKNADYYCIINSLFLLPEPKKILLNISDSMKQSGFLFVIVPNTNGKNFKTFNSLNKALNKLILEKKDFDAFFDECDLKIKNVEGIAFTTNYGRKDVKFFSIFSHLYLTLLNFFQTFFTIGSPNYYLIVLEK